MYARSGSGMLAALWRHCARPEMLHLAREHAREAGVGIELRLGPEPRAALLQDVRAVLLDRAAGLFFRVIPWRWKKRDRAEVDVAMPRPANCSRNSSSVWK